MNRIVKEILDVSFHRNGVSGKGFIAVLFTMYNEDGVFIASVPYDDYRGTTVFNVDKLAEGNIKFGEGENSWRGDNIGYELKDVVQKMVEEKFENQLKAFMESE